MFKKSILLLNIILIKLLNSQTATSVPVIYYSNGELMASTQGIQLALLYQCENSTANLPLVQLSIIQPENPTFDNTRAFAVVEISSNPNSFASQYIIGANYLKNGGQMQAFNNITFAYSDSLDNLAIRYKSYIGMSPITLMLTYVNNNNGENPIFTGGYVSTVFNTISVPGSPTYFSQQVKLDVVGNVLNSQYQYYYFSLCEKDLFIGSTTYYTVDIEVASDLSTRHAAFDLVACSARDVPDFAQDCTVTNSGLTPIVINDNPACIARVTMDSRYQYLSDGIYVGVFGYGGELTSNNAFLLNVDSDAD